MRRNEVPAVLEVIPCGVNARDAAFGLTQTEGGAKILRGGTQMTDAFVLSLVTPGLTSKHIGFRCSTGWCRPISIVTELAELFLA